MIKKELKDQLKIHTGDRFNILVALVKDDRVCELKEFDKRDKFFDTMISVYRSLGYNLEVFVIDEKNNTPPLTITKNGKPFPNKVMCIETGETWDSVTDCSEATGIAIHNIRASIYRNTVVCGSRFKLIPSEKNKKDE